MKIVSCSGAYVELFRTRLRCREILLESLNSCDNLSQTAGPTGILYFAGAKAISDFSLNMHEDATASGDVHVTANIFAGIREAITKRNRVQTFLHSHSYFQITGEKSMLYGKVHSIAGPVTAKEI